MNSSNFSKIYKLKDLESSNLLYETNKRCYLMNKQKLLFIAILLGVYLLELTLTGGYAGRGLLHMGG